MQFNGPTSSISYSMEAFFRILQFIRQFVIVSIFLECNPMDFALNLWYCVQFQYSKVTDIDYGVFFEEKDQ